MTSNYIFISYKHGDPSTRIAKHLYDHLSAVSDALDITLYMDDKDNLGGDPWSVNVETALNLTTHFIALLDTQYWLSKECRRELLHALNRFENTRVPRLLFVKAQEIRPDLFRFDKDRAKGELVSPEPQVQAIGDLHFLGPFDDNLRLVRLYSDDPPRMQDQIAQLLDRLERVLIPASGKR